MYPNFLVIGAQRSGTTTLYNHFLQHPDIYVNPQEKELKFLLKMHRENLPFETYQEYFTGWNGEKAVGDVSPPYLYFEYVPELIAKFLPDAKLIATLRNPIDRAYSSYCYALRTGREQHTFETAIERKHKGPHLNDYIGKGMYSIQLERYFKRFDRSQMLILLFEDLTNSEETTMKSIYAFLEVDTDVPLKLNDKGENKQNSAQYPRYPYLHRAWAVSRKVPLVKNVVKSIDPRQIPLPLQDTYPPIRPETRERLREIYRADTEKLSNLLNRDVSYWLQTADNLV